MEHRFVITISCVLLLSVCYPKIITSVADKRNHEMTGKGEVDVQVIGDNMPDNETIIVDRARIA